MLTLHDDRSMKRVALGARGRLRIRVAGPFDTVSGLRALLLADLIRRVGELADHTVTVYTAGEPVPARARALGIGSAEPADADADVDADVRINEPGSGVNMRVAGARLTDTADPRLDEDPYPLKLALFAVPYREPADLAHRDLTAAAAELALLRGEVAECAEQPSRPPEGRYARAVLDALADDADTPGALAALRRAAGDRLLPPGARFETMLLIDRMLGLELPRDIGRPR